MEINISRKPRLFLALQVDEKYHHRMKDIQLDLMDDLEYLPHSVSWTKKNRLHLTIFFLGEQSPQAIQTLIAEITKMNSKASPEKIQFNATDVELFPTPRPTVIALTGGCLKPLRALRDNLMQCLDNIQMHPDVSHETHGFLPHITVGKLTEATDLKSQPCEISVDFSQLILFRSEQTAPSVVTHTPIHSWSLV